MAVPNKVVSDPLELASIQRLLDVTRATMFFSRGVIFVEGITEELLLPIFARKIKKPLEEKGISVVGMHGVEFLTLAKLFGNNDFEIDIPVAIITDSDPKQLVKVGSELVDWDKKASTRGEVFPEKGENNNYLPCERLGNLEELISGKNNMIVCLSKVTLEYELALAGDSNPLLMIEAWKKFYVRQPGLSAESLSNHTTLEDKALHIWREICLSQAKVTKAEFAH